MPRHFLAKSRKRKCNFLFSYLLENGVRGGTYSSGQKGSYGGYYESRIYNIGQAFFLRLHGVLVIREWYIKGFGLSLRCVVRQEGGGENKE